MRHRLAALLFAALVLVLAAFTGTSLAGNGHGKGGGSDQSQQSSKQSDTTTASTSATATADNSQGVKPDSTTQHDTHASASSNQTKEYGNGKTAGQIATQAGDGTAMLHGPGNSQPHKTGCGSHEVDVHALKHQSSKCASTQQTTSTQSASHSESHGQQKHEQAQSTQATTQSTQSAGVSASAQQHVTICHATGSATNPFVMISPSASGVFHGHMGHQGGRDIIPPFTWNGVTLSQNWDTNGQAIFNAGCTVAAPAAAAQTQATVNTQVASTAATTASTSTAVTTTTQAATQATTQAATSTPAATGAVKGAAVAVKAKPKTTPAGGVLGTTTRLGGSVGSSRLPFTGLPLWIFALVGVGLIGTGLFARRASAGRL